MITRDDYLGFPAGRRALAGIVQALLITRHMLFVGFSLRDDNFHQIAYDVRKAAPQRAGDAAFGTALFLEQADMLRNVWGDDLAIETVGGGGVDPGRALLLLLDRVLAESTSVYGHLRDETFDTLLSPDERAVRDALETARIHARRADPSLAALLEDSLAAFGRRSGAP